MMSTSGRGPKAALRAAVGLALALACAAGVSGCVPEPSEAPMPTGDAKERLEQGEDGAGEQSWPEREPEGGLPKSTELPASFPREEFPLPAGAVIDNAGERSDGSWFVVLRAEDSAAADALWQAVIDGGGFSADDVVENESGRSARLSGASLVVDALTVPQEDGAVLLSYDVQRAG